MFKHAKKDIEDEGGDLDGAEPTMADDDDPMVKLMDALAGAEDSHAAKVREKKDVSAQEAAAKMAELALKRRDLELKAQQQRDRAIEAEEKRRTEQMKSIAKAMKTAATVKADVEAAEVSEADTIPARIEALRKIGLMQQMLQTPGSARRVNRDTPLPVLLAELDIMDQQANMARATGTPETALLMGLETGEDLLAPIYDVRGLANDFRTALTRSKQSRDPMEKQLEQAMLHCSIKYSDWFAVKPETYILLTLAKMAKERHEHNMKGRVDAGQEAEYTDELAAEFERRFAAAQGGRRRAPPTVKVEEEEEEDDD